MNIVLDQFKALQKTLLAYFAAYGGWRAILYSPLFLLAFVITIASYSSWLSARWVTDAQTTIPNLLGFSLGTYAMLFSLMTNRIRSALRQTKNDVGISNLLMINATFLHFIFVQVVALTWAYVFNGTALYDLFNLVKISHPLSSTIFSVLYVVGSFLGNLLFIYSIMLIFGAAMIVYRLAQIRDPAEDENS